MTLNEPSAIVEFSHDDRVFASGRCSSWVNRHLRITLITFWYEPLSNSTVDVEAAQIAIDFMFGLWMDPITYGRYPRTMKDLVEDRLLEFTYNESRLLRGSYDFLGLQYYAAYYAQPNATIDPNYIRYKIDSHVIETRVDNFNNGTQSIDEAL
ncbi:hypothetical protein GH714_009663 [Hevea brasiliensis]|uniref:Beta-glucosidase n=1 Tax=Hevea brasiliensis TaxID=3981 RepID=A0A6A6KIA4_HEVBR|nr:hypothetical protein GH714_009663 [Hevea brasiliensis]